MSIWAALGHLEQSAPVIVSGVAGHPISEKVSKAMKNIQPSTREATLIHTKKSIHFPRSSRLCMTVYLETFQLGTPFLKEVLSRFLGNIYI